MKNLFDTHNHSQFSFDGKRTSAELSARSALDKGLGGIVFTDHYEPADPAPWGAQEAYQVYFSDSFLNTYLVCWEERIVEIKFYWEPTPEQIRLAAEKLSP